MKKVTLLGNWSGSIAAIACVGLVSGLSRLSQKAAVLITASIAASALFGFCVSSLIKAATERQRPLDRLIEIDSFAYPSGHATTAFALYFCGALLFAHLTESRRNQRLILAAGVCIALLVASSRLFLGVHWLSDIAAGFTLGSACAFSTLILLANSDAKPLNP